MLPVSVGPDDSSVNNALEAFDLSKTKLLKLSFGLKISEDMIAWSVAAENKSSVFLFLTVSSFTNSVEVLLVMNSP